LDNPNLVARLSSDAPPARSNSIRHLSSWLQTVHFGPDFIRIFPM
jgi:hypothetical protein